MDTSKQDFDMTNYEIARDTYANKVLVCMESQLGHDLKGQWAQQGMVFLFSKPSELMGQHAQNNTLSWVYLAARARYRVATTQEEKEFWETYELLGRQLQPTIGGGTGGCYLGSDPEVFVVDENDKVIPAWEFLPTQAKRGHGQAFWDGFQAEFVTNHRTCLVQLLGSVQTGLSQVLHAARQFNPQARLTSRSVMLVEQQVLDQAADEHVVFGCAPSENVYNATGVLDGDSRQIRLRPAGCHMHFGYSSDVLKKHPATELVRLMDSFAAVLQVCILRGIEDPRRRSLYGRAGEYRLPKHGLEYRVPSASVLCHPVVAHLCFDLTRFAQHLVRQGWAKYWEVAGGDDRVQHIINTCDVDDALTLVKENGEFVARALHCIYPALRSTYTNDSKIRTDRAMALILEGAKEYLPIDEMEKSWWLSAPGQGGLDQLQNFAARQLPKARSIIEKEKLERQAKAKLKKQKD